MAANQDPTENFYRGVDQARHQTNWSCLGLLVFFVIAAALIAWLLLGQLSK